MKKLYVDEAGHEWPCEVKPAHTPTPWGSKHAVIASGDEALDCAISALIDGRERCIAECFGRVGQDVFVDADANAAFIVRAVNAHEELLSFVKIIAEDYECVADTEGKNGCEHCRAVEAITKAEEK